MCFWRFLHLLHDRSWDRSLTDLGSILVPKIVPKSDPKRFRKVSKFLVVFDRPPGPPKIDFWPTWPQHGSNLAPTWPPRWAQVGPQAGSKSVQKRPRGPNWPRNRFGDDFLTIFDRFSIAFWLILDCFLMLLGPPYLVALKLYLWDLWLLGFSAWALALGFQPLGFSSWVLALGL